MSQVPVIDFGPFLNGTAEQRQQVAKQLHEAYTQIGFAALINHSVPLSLIDKSFQESRNFFAMSDEEKSKLAWKSAESNRGFLSKGRESLATSNGDYKETFEIGNEKETQFPNHWPTSAQSQTLVPDFKSTMLELFESADRAHLEILSAIAMGLGLDQDYFTSLCNENHQNLRLLHYPPIERSKISEDGLVRAGDHTDYGTVTLLFQDKQGGGGLYVLDRSNQWVHVEPIEGSIVVNIGDCLQRWSNDILLSNRHKVLLRPGQEEHIPARYTIAFFSNPNKSTTVECLPGCSSAERPAKYAPVNAFDYLCGRLNETIGKY